MMIFTKNVEETKNFYSENKSQTEKFLLLINNIKHEKFWSFPWT